MRMFGAAINFPLVENLMAEAILRQHPLRRNLEQALGLGLEHLAGSGRADSAGPSGMPMVLLAERLRSRQANLGGIDNNHEVAGILVRSVVGTRFAGQQACGARRDAAECSLARIDHDPLAVTQSTLAGDAAGLFGQFQIRAPSKINFWRGRWDLNPRLPT